MFGLQGYAFCEYQYREVTDVVIDDLNLQSVGSKTLTVKRAVAGQAAPQVTPTLPPHQRQQPLPTAVSNALSMQRLQQATQIFTGMPLVSTLAGMPP